MGCLVKILRSIISGQHSPEIRKLNFSALFRSDRKQYSPFHTIQIVIETECDSFGVDLSITRHYEAGCNGTWGRPQHFNVAPATVVNNRIERV